jgi:polypeptide N-acetylgalactosaminyltransferase
MHTATLVTDSTLGFNLKLSNELALDRPFPDYRMEPCKPKPYPPASEMPKVSVIIIYYNEPLSTLLRNVGR